jgi:3-methyladenine DNA glycosylase AlkD
MAGIRAAVNATWREHALDGLATIDALDLAHAWFARPHSEDKLAAVLVLGERIPGRLELAHVPALARPFEVGWLADWNVVDWMAVKGIAPFLRDRPDTCERLAAIAGWAQAPGLWQRRAAAVALVPLAPLGDAVCPGFVDTALVVCAANVAASRERWAHTGPGWLLRELSIAAPDAVRAFIERTPELSPEGRRMASARLRGGPYRRR